MKIANIRGIQHIGIPVRDLDRTIEFYEGLGFEMVHRPLGRKVAFLQLGTCVLVCYEETETAGQPGAIDHISLDVTNIDQVYRDIRAAQYPITTDGIESLPFWDKGIRFFKIKGPDAESIEFCEILR